MKLLLGQQISSVSHCIWAPFSPIYLSTNETKESKKAVQPCRAQLFTRNGVTWMCLPYPAPPPGAKYKAKTTAHQNTFNCKHLFRKKFNMTPSVT